MRPIEITGMPRISSKLLLNIFVLVVGCVSPLWAENSARVLRPSVCRDPNNDNIVGISTTRGEVVDSSGRVIGSINDFDCTTWTSRKDVPIKALNKYVHGMSSALFVQSCKTDGSLNSNQEKAYAIYLDSNGRLANILIGTGDNKEVKTEMPEGLRGRILATVHDHPALQDKSTGACFEGAGCAHLWPSSKDAVAMIKRTDWAGFPVHSYILDCHEQSLIRLNAVEKKNEKFDANVGVVKRVSATGDETDLLQPQNYVGAYVRAEYVNYRKEATEPVVMASANGMKIGGYNFMSPRVSRARDTARRKNQVVKSNKAEEKKSGQIANPDTVSTACDRKTSADQQVISSAMKKRWEMRDERPIRFDNIVFGTSKEGKRNTTYPITLKDPYYVFHKAEVRVIENRIDGIEFEARIPKQLTKESMAIAEQIRKDIERSCGIKLDSDNRPCNRTYKWYGTGTVFIQFDVQNENDETPGEAFFLLNVSAL